MATDVPSILTVLPVPITRINADTDIGVSMSMLKRHKPLNQYSPKKIKEMNAEIPERLKLIKRCGGIPHIYQRKVRCNGKYEILTRVACMGGVCECGCGKPANYRNGQLCPHEDPPRSKGGKVSLSDSIMVLPSCHRRLQGREPKLEWIKDNE